MVRSPRCSPDFVEFQQFWVHECADRVEVPNRRDPTNSKACLRADQCCICLAQRFTSHRSGLGLIDAIAASGQKQDGVAAVLSLKNDRFGNLIDLAAHGIGRVQRRAGQFGFLDLGFKSSRL